MLTELSEHLISEGRIMFKLIVTDLDGTLLNSEHKVSNRTIKTIKQLRESGMKFVIATGRHYQDVKQVAQQIGGDIYLITSNGAQIHDKAGELFYNRHIEPSKVQTLLEISQKYPLHRNIYQKDQWLAEEHNQILQNMQKHSNFIYQISDFKQLSHRDISKFFFIADEAILKELEAELIQEFGHELNISFSLSYCLEVMATGVSKASALQQILNIKSIPSSRVMGFGDGMNDHEMLQLVAHPVLMENASSTLYECLPNAYQTLSCDKDGVAYYLEHLLN